MAEMESYRTIVDRYMVGVAEILGEYVILSLKRAYGADWWSRGVVEAHSRRQDRLKQQELKTKISEFDRIQALDIQAYCCCRQAPCNSAAFEELIATSRNGSGAFISIPDSHLIKDARNMAEHAQREYTLTETIIMLHHFSKGVACLDPYYAKEIIDKIEYINRKESEKRNKTGTPRSESLYDPPQKLKNEDRTAVKNREQAVKEYLENNQLDTVGSKAPIAEAYGSDISPAGHPKYSILYSGYSFIEKKDEVDSYLNDGIKVLWFGSEIEKSQYYSKYTHKSAELLYVYRGRCRKKFMIYDGNPSTTSVSQYDLDTLADDNSQEFDYDQFKAEHSNGQVIKVLAGAGSGKTKTMIDHVLFLLSTRTDIDASEIAMITFTNKAASSMKNKFQELLLNRFEATGNTRYLSLMEKQSQMTVSTIDKFLLNRIQDFGPDAGFSPKMKIRSMSYEVDRILKKLLDEYDDKYKELKIAPYDLKNNLKTYIESLIGLGFSYEELLSNLDYGKFNVNGTSISDAVSFTFNGFNRDYRELKQKEDSLEVKDILTTFTENASDEKIKRLKSKIKYLLVDEFQDTNTTQIAALTTFVKTCSASIFVVGDQNQNIYGFRGASREAFKILSEKIDIDTEIVLHRNYRTSQKVLDVLNPFFRRFTDEKWLDVPINGDMKSFFVNAPGKVTVLSNDAFDKNLSRDTAVVSCIKNIRKTCNGSIAIIAPTNNHLYNIAQTLRNNDIPYKIVKDGTFYISDPVRDLYLFLSTFVYSEDMYSSFNYAISPYNTERQSIQIGSKIHAELKRDLGNLKYGEQWMRYKNDFERYPFMQVLVRIISEVDVISSYSWILENRIKNDSTIKDKAQYINDKALEYRLNLDKLITILQSNFSQESSTLYEVCEYLRIAIGTNREEDKVSILNETDMESTEGHPGNSPVECITAHKSKGLEYDTVIIPISDYDFIDKKSNVFVERKNKQNIGQKNKQKVGAAFESSERDKDGNKTIYKNENYDELQEINKQDLIVEACHLLYVSMTRARKNLVFIYCPYDNNKQEKMTWSKMLSICKPELISIKALQNADDWNRYLAGSERW